MERRVKGLLWDMLDAGEKVQQYCAGLDEAAYLRDDLVQSAVERKMSILGEAMFQASKIEPDWENLVTDASRIVAFRHLIIHGYAEIPPERVWRAATEAVPRLLDQLRKLLGSEEP